MTMQARSARTHTLTHGRRLDRHVRVVGAGLLGASIGLALTEQGTEVSLDDSSPSQLRLAVDYGAGRTPREDDDPALVVVAVPPDVVADVVADQLERHPNAVVTDVASVKGEPLRALERKATDLARYIGSHPMAGRERGGAISARADLFVGRPWVICRDGQTTREALALIEDLALDLGATPIEMTPEEHDAAVGVISHVPQVVSSLLAARLVEAPDASLRLVGQGLRDTVRIASSSPELWVQILEANRDPVAEVLRELRTDLDATIHALENPDVDGAHRFLAQSIEAGNVGVSRLPGKHGQERRFAQIVVMVDDTPGQLGKLLTELGEINVNMEDLRLEHSPGTAIGLAEISVLPEVKQRTITDLEARGWRIASV